MATSRKKFKTEVQQLLDLVIHSLYSNNEIFLRELLSNASDAIDRARFEALSQKDLLAKDSEWKIKLFPDKDTKTLRIVDNGIGMNRDELDQNIGTIANSGTKVFMEQLEKSGSKDNPGFIGQFGVGFYSVFMVADKVTLLTRRAGKEQAAYKWESSGGGSYTISDDGKETQGTEIILHLREGTEEYLEEWRLRKIIKQYSDFIEYPISMDITREEPSKDKKNDQDKTITVTEEVLNSMKAIWMRSKAELKDSDYNEFYKHLSHDYSDPLRVVHFAAEGVLEFRALLYIPHKAPFDLYWRDSNKGLHLYVKRIMIMDDCKELLPEYLRFVTGVVEANDLPLNVSRQMLQEDKIVRKIQKNLVNKILNTLTELKEKNPDSYNVFYQEFGKVLKEGMHLDPANLDKLQKLIQFESSKSKPSEYVSLSTYVKRMPQDQTEIYYLTGSRRELVENSPHLEIFKSKDYEVLFLIDPIDEWVVQNLNEYEGKKLKSIDRGDITFSAENEEKKDDKDSKKKSDDDQSDELIAYIKKQFEAEVKDVKLSKRLIDSPACLVADESGMSANMERIFKSMNQKLPENKRILELNPKHSIFKIIHQLFQKDKKNKKLRIYCQLLLDQALLTEGSPIKNPLQFSKWISELMIAEGKTLLSSGAKRKG